MNLSSFRLDRLLTLLFFYPLMRVGLGSKELRIPILMYHSISESAQSDIHPYYQTSTSPQVFAKHMKFLYENGYSVIDLNGAVKIISSGASEPLVQGSSRLPNLTSFKYSSIPQKIVVLTFDDGFRDFYNKAFPILQEYGFTATVFLATGFVNYNRLSFRGKDCLTWHEVYTLSRNRVIFGSHTVNHPELASLDIEKIEFELKQSKRQIEDVIGDQIESFSYPYAFPEQGTQFRTSLRTLLEESGYKCGVTTKIGRAKRNDDLFFLKRIPLNSLDDQILFEAKLAGAYDWLYELQYLFKLLRVKPLSAS